MKAEWQLHLVIAIARETHFWPEIEARYKALPDHELIRYNQRPSPLYMLEPAAVCHGLMLLAINEYDKEFFGYIASKVFRKEMAYCESRGEALTLRDFLNKFGRMDPTTLYMMRQLSIYIQMRDSLGLPPDDNELIQKIEQEEFCIYHELLIPDSESAEAAAKWYKEHQYKSFSDIQCDDKYNIEFMEALDYICNQDSISIAILEEMPITKQDIANFFHIAKISDNIDIDAFLPWAYLLKEFSVYMKKCRDEYIKLYFTKIFAKEKSADTKIVQERDSYKALAEQKQEQLNSMQLENDRLKRELAKMQDEKAKLEDYAAILDSQFALNGEISTFPEAVPPFSTEGKNIVIIGGHEIWQNHMKKEFPNFTYIGSEQYNFDVNVLKNADIVAFNFIHCSHKIFYRIRENVDKSKIIYINSNNIDRFKQIIANAL